MTDNTSTETNNGNLGTALALMDSMIRGGEGHSRLSLTVLANAKLELSTLAAKVAELEAAAQPQAVTVKPLEALAELEHQQWAHWTEYMLANLTQENVERWRKQISTAYADLTEPEKESDRKWARKVSAITTQSVAVTVKPLEWAPHRNGNVCANDPHGIPKFVVTKDPDAYDAKRRESIFSTITTQSAAAQPQAVTVKPLEWEAISKTESTAPSTIGEFCVYCEDGHGWLAMTDGHDDAWVNYPTQNDDCGFNTKREAIAECERHLGAVISKNTTTQSVAEVRKAAFDEAAYVAELHVAACQTPSCAAKSHAEIAEAIRALAEGTDT